MRTLPRSQVINDLREYLIGLTDEKHTICDVAARLGIFCRGLKRFSDDELRKRFDWIAQTRRGITRTNLENLANRYTLARQEVIEVPFACDALMVDRDSCTGWDEFSDQDLARFYKEWYGEEVQVVALPDEAT